jgi:hypothetical protein
MSDFPRKTIRASEIGQYSYCPQAWYLGNVLGYPSSNVIGLEAGTESHRRHGRGVSLAMTLQKAGLILIVLGFLALTAYAIMLLMGG